MADRLEMISEMLKQHPADPFLNYALALEYKKNGQNSRAIELLKKLIASQPDYLASYYQLGKLLEEENKIDEAIKTYRSGKIIATKAQDPKTLGELNEALLLLDAEDEF